MSSGLNDSSDIMGETGDKPSKTTHDGIDAENTQDSKDKSKHKKIGDYIIGKSIGKGTFGKVKKGIHIKTNEKVAI